MVLEKEIERIRSFIATRGWEGVHTPKDLSMSIAIEAAELMEIFQWKEHTFHSLNECPEDMERVSDELADVLIYILEFADMAGMDLEKIIDKKMEKNERKYPPINLNPTEER